MSKKPSKREIRANVLRSLRAYYGNREEFGSLSPVAARALIGWLALEVEDLRDRVAELEIHRSDGAAVREEDRL